MMEGTAYFTKAKSYEWKMFMKSTPGTNVIKFFGRNLLIFVVS
jgi:hypothetical protein